MIPTELDLLTERPGFTPALEAALRTVAQNVAIFGAGYPDDTTFADVYRPRPARDERPEGSNHGWTTSFWPGMLWLSYELTGDEAYRLAGELHVQGFAERVERGIDLDTHDLGFLYTLACVAPWRLTGNEQAKRAALEAAEHLMTRFLEPAGIIQVWGDLSNPEQRGRTIIDSLMNMPLLYWASEMTGDPRYREAAHRHTAQLRDHMIRPDDTTFHTFYWDVETGEPLRGGTQQGHADHSCWARGQAWGIYGFTLNYRYTSDETFLRAAERCADYFLDHLPADHVAYWDLVFADGSGEERDSSAAAIAVCGLDELARWLPGGERKQRYQDRRAGDPGLAVASVALGEVAGCSPLRPGQSRRLLSQTLRYFLEHGAVSGGMLSRGWHGEHLASLQPYSGPASPYWASKGFVGLLLPPDHPLWTATEERLDDEDVDVVHSIASVGWLIQRTGRDGIARVHNHGSDHMMPEEADGGQPDPQYARFAYSTRTGKTAVRNVPDNDVHVTIRDVPSVRRRIHPLGGGADWAASYHVPQFPVPAAISGGGPVGKGPVLPSSRIESLVIVRGSWEVRVHRFTGVPHGTAVSVSGWALAATTPVGLHVLLQNDSPPEADQHHPAGESAKCGPTRVKVIGSGLVSELIGSAGWSSAASRRAPQGTAYGNFAIVPELSGTMRPGLFVALARLTTSDEADPPVVSASTDRVVVQWHDGVHRVDWASDKPDVIWVPTVEGTS